jgi:peptidoglycan/LPS O-acetylase OafA/YrhL
MGITAFQKRSGLIKTGEAFILYGICFLCSSWTLGLPHTIAGAVALYLISAVNLHNVVLNFLGNISYSLYLLHAIIGGSVISIGIRVGFTGSGAGRVAVLIAALAASLFSAFMLYLFVEKPAQKWSSSFVYKPAAKTIPDQTRMALQTTINPSGAVLLSEKNVPTEGTAN